MFTQTVTIDQSRRIVLPEQVLDALGITVKDKIIVEVTQAGAIIKPERATPITDEIASMNLPVTDWEQMEREIEEGRIA